jgi:hypothetical protein
VAPFDWNPLCWQSHAEGPHTAQVFTSAPGGRAESMQSDVSHVDRCGEKTFDNTRIFWHYMAAQGIAGIAVVELFPRVAE